jgi:ferredoxin
MAGGMRVWIDQEECTGAGLCEVIEPSVFVIGEEGLALVRSGDAVQPAGPTGTVTVTPENEREVREASLACPGRCIRIEAE